MRGTSEDCHLVHAMLDMSEWLDKGHIGDTGEWEPGLEVDDVIEVQLALQFRDVLFARDVPASVHGGAAAPFIRFPKSGMNLCRGQGRVKSIYEQFKRVKQLRVPTETSQGTSEVEIALDCRVPITLQGFPLSMSRPIHVREGGYLEFLGYLWCYVSEFSGMEFHPFRGRLNRIEVIDDSFGGESYTPVLVSLQGSTEPYVASVHFERRRVVQCD